MSTSKTSSEPALRHEWKFALSGADIAALRTLLRVNARPVRFGDGPVSRVHSIYFDDDRLSSCRETLAGVAHRTKVRLRWYDRPLPAGGPLFFELKQRRGAMMSKQRFELDLETAGSYEGMARELGRRLPEAPVAWLRLRPNPVVIVSYRREHFQDRDGPTRVTLDYAIVGCDQLGRLGPTRTHGQRLEELAVVEIKAPPGEEEAARRILYPWRPRLTRNSKYARCCLATGWGGLQERYE